MSLTHDTNVAPAAGLGEPSAEPQAPAFHSRLVFLLAITAALGVAPVYYSQPMLSLMGQDLGASERLVGLVPTLTQLGYALGILFLAPLGDRFDRRRVILVKASALAITLLAAAAAPSIGILLVASLATGVAATMAQDIVPAAAIIAPAAQRGKVVGTVMTGLLLGILMSRVVSGYVAGLAGWRTMFAIAAASVAATGIAAWFGLPGFPPTTRMRYGALLASLGNLWRTHGSLRRAAVAQGLIAVGFSAFWSTLAMLLHGAPFHLGSEAAGAFGLAGGAGALAAPMAGRLADRGGPERVTRIGACLAIVSFAAMGLLPMLSPHAQLVLLAICAMGFDLGVQVTLVGHQTIVYGLDPAARGRLNAVLFVGMFIGMAMGAGLGSLLFAQWGWAAVTALATATACAALVVRLWRSSAAMHAL